MACTRGPVRSGGELGELRRRAAALCSGPTLSPWSISDFTEDTSPEFMALIQRTGELHVKKLTRRAHAAARAGNAVTAEVRSFSCSLFKLTRRTPVLPCGAAPFISTGVKTRLKISLREFGGVRCVSKSNIIQGGVEHFPQLHPVVPPGRHHAIVLAGGRVAAPGPRPGSSGRL